MFLYIGFETINVQGFHFMDWAISQIVCNTYIEKEYFLGAQNFQATPIKVIQYTLANPNRGVPIRKISVPITEFVRISEVASIIWKINNTKICDNPLLLV